MIDISRLRKALRITWTEEERRQILAGEMCVIRGILDDDIYKFFMQQAAVAKYDNLDVEYDFTDRGQNKYHPRMAEVLRKQVDLMANFITPEWGIEGMRKMGFFKRSYLDFLRGYQFNPNEVTIKQSRGKLSIKIKGPWYRTILWEVPLLAMVSEINNLLYGREPKEDIFWNNLEQKMNTLVEADAPYADFGTRRRFNFMVHDAIVTVMKECCPNFVGTSNVHLALKHGIKAIGTHAHEWFMAHQALYGTRSANWEALDAWSKVYGGRLGTALTDTFTTDAFLKVFGPRLARLFDGVRHDSGDPFEFGEKMIKHYEGLGIEPKSKLIIFSDGLDANLAKRLADHFRGRIKISFGIGTFLTNDCGHEALRIVIKLSRVKFEHQGDEDFVNVVKLSDNPGKHHGPKKEIEHTQYELGIAA
jgi:nicotinate phosphoribosyltransferase